MDWNIDLLKEGDKNEFEKFVHLYRESAENFAMKLVNDIYTAQDIVQESFAKFYVYRDKLDNNKSVKAYFFSIIHNKCVDYVRKRNKEVYKEF